LLSRDRGLLKRSVVTHGYFVRETDSRRQLAEVVRHFNLRCATAPFQRCLRCNGLLQPALKQDVELRLPPRTNSSIVNFMSAPPAAGIYWKWSHCERMQGLMERVFAQD
jgi:uncharacterized protein with PIN domain